MDSRRDALECGAEVHFGVVMRPWRALVLCLLGTSLSASANHLFESEIMHPDPDATYFADRRMKHYDIVAWGEFVAVCDDVVGEEWFRSRDVTARFRIAELFKGDPSALDLSVIVPADILAFPGQSRTRHEVREEILDSLRGRVEAARRRLDELEESRLSMDAQTYSDAKRREEGALMALVEESLGRYPGRHIAVVHGRMIWEVGGVIRTGQMYLLTINRDGNGDIRLTEVHDGLLWWGEEARQMLDRLRGEYGAIKVSQDQ